MSEPTRAPNLRPKPPAKPSGNPPAAAPQKGERHYRRAQHDRGAETRERLIAAALDIFGRQGFEGATTREIAKAANANLAAIVYHFGSKEALHVAVAEYLTARVSALIGPLLAAAVEPGASATAGSARKALALLLEAYADVILGEAEAERWARFIIREQMQPSPAFDVIYRYMGNSHALATRLVAAILGRSEDDEDVKLRVFTMMGQIMVFRVAHALVLRRMGWRAIGERQRALIKRIIVSQVSAILSDGVPS